MSSSHEVPKMVGVYKKLFLLLTSITCLGIIAALLHLPVWLAVVIALGIIAIKGKFVLDAFKDLLTPRRALVILFALTGFFFLTVLLLPFLNKKDHLVGSEDTSNLYQTEQTHAGGHTHGD